MSPMIVIILTVVIGSALILGVLIGASMHREATRKQRRRNEREWVAIEHARMVLEEQQRMLDRGV